MGFVGWMVSRKMDKKVRDLKTILKSFNKIQMNRGGERLGGKARICKLTDSGSKFQILCGTKDIRQKIKIDKSLTKCPRPHFL